jgi:nitrogenase molybdenum-iron protein NifN
MVDILKRNKALSVNPLKANDTLISASAEISGRDVSERIERQSSQLQNAMLDTHFMLGQL